MAVQQEALPRTAQTATLADVLERVLDKGIVIAGDIKLFLADVEILTLQIRLVVCSVDKAKEVGLDWWTGHHAFGGKKQKDEQLDQVNKEGEERERLEQRLSALERELSRRNERRETHELMNQETLPERRSR